MFYINCEKVKVINIHSDLYISKTKMFGTREIFVLLGVLFVTSDAAFKLEERYSWNQLDFVFPSQSMKDVALASGSYIPTNALPVGVEHWGNRLFVTVPRWRDGKKSIHFSRSAFYFDGLLPIEP